VLERVAFLPCTRLDLLFEEAPVLDTLAVVGLDIAVLFDTI
jgi:hypothetical protein